MKYTVPYTELLGRTFIVDADSEEEAREKVLNAVQNEFIILTADDYVMDSGDIAAAIANAACTKHKKYIRFDGKKCDESVLNNRNWCQHFLKELCKQDMDIEFIGNNENLYSDFTYVITGDYDNFGGKFDVDKTYYLIRINVKVYDGDEQGQLLFDGSGLEYLGWKNWD